MYCTKRPLSPTITFQSRDERIVEMIVEMTVGRDSRGILEMIVVEMIGEITGEMIVGRDRRGDTRGDINT